MIHQPTHAVNSYILFVWRSLEEPGEPGGAWRAWRSLESLEDAPRRDDDDDLHMHTPTLTAAPLHPNHPGGVIIAGR